MGEASNRFYDALPGIVQRTMDHFAELTGRAYHLFDYHGAPDADRVIVVMGSGSETVRETVDALIEAGEKVGVVTVRLSRPFDTSALVAACSDADALMIPVGGFYTLSGPEAVRAVKALQPKLTAPMHYRCPGHSFEAISTEGPFLKALPADVPVHRLDELTEPFPAGVVLLTPQKP